MPVSQSNHEPGEDPRRKAVEQIHRYYTERLDLEKRWEDKNYVYSPRSPVGFYTRSRMHHSFMRLLNKHNIVLSDKTILDIGCGTGDWLCFISELRGSSTGLVGIDITGHRIEKARSINPGIEFVMGDAAALPFDDASFDIVTQFVTFEHFLDNETLAKACREVSRVLKASGFLIWYDLLPFPPGADPINRGFSLKEVVGLFPEFRLLHKEPIFASCNFGSRNFSTFNIVSIFNAMPTFAALIADIFDRLPLMRRNNILVLMVKGANMSSDAV